MARAIRIIRQGLTAGRFQTLALSLTLALGLNTGLIVSSALAADPDPVQQQNSTAIWFENWFGLSNATLTVTAPNGAVTALFAASGTPVYQLVIPGSGDPVLDGLYRYELTAAGEDRVEIVNAIDNGRGEAAQDSLAKSFALTGQFTVARGVIIPPEDIQEDSK